MKKEKREIGSLRIYGPALTHVTEKHVPSVDNCDGEALVAPLLLTIVIDWTAAVKDTMVPVTPAIVA